MLPSSVVETYAFKFPSSSPVINRGIFSDNRRQSRGLFDAHVTPYPSESITSAHPGFASGISSKLPPTPTQQPTAIYGECKMDAALKELAKLEKLTADGKAKSPPIDQTLDALLATLRAERERVQSGSASPDAFDGLATKVESLKKDLDDRQKEIYNSISRYGKALDKVRPLDVPRLIGNGQLHHPAQKFPNSLPTFSPLFTSTKASQALDRTVALHFLRTGQFTTAETFIEVHPSATPIPSRLYPRLGSGRERF